MVRITKVLWMIHVYNSVYRQFHYLNVLSTSFSGHLLKFGSSCCFYIFSSVISLVFLTFLVLDSFNSVDKTWLRGKFIRKFSSSCCRHPVGTTSASNAFRNGLVKASAHAQNAGTQSPQRWQASQESIQHWSLQFEWQRLQNQSPRMVP